MFYCSDLAFYPVIFYNCHFIAVTLIAKSLLLPGHWRISKKTQTLHVLFKYSGEFGLTAIQWGQKARARTSQADLLIFSGILTTKRKYFLRYLLLSTVVKKTQKMIRSRQTKPFNQSGTSGLDNLLSWFCFLVYLATSLLH